MRTVPLIYYGNGNGNVHISSPNGGKFYIWELNDGLEIWYNVPSHIIKLMPERDFARAVQRQIETVVGLAGFGKGR